MPRVCMQSQSHPVFPPQLPPLVVDWHLLFEKEIIWVSTHYQSPVIPSFMDHTKVMEQMCLRMMWKCSRPKFHVSSDLELGDHHLGYQLFNLTTRLGTYPCQPHVFLWFNWSATCCWFFQLQMHHLFSWNGTISCHLAVGSEAPSFITYWWVNVSIVFRFSSWWASVLHD